VWRFSGVTAPATVLRKHSARFRGLAGSESVCAARVDSASIVSATSCDHPLRQQSSVGGLFGLSIC